MKNIPYKALKSITLYYILPGILIYIISSDIYVAIGFGALFFTTVHLFDILKRSEINYIAKIVLISAFGTITYLMLLSRKSKLMDTFLYLFFGRIMLECYDMFKKSRLNYISKILSALAFGTFLVLLGLQNKLMYFYLFLLLFAIAVDGIRWCYKRYV